MRWKLKTINGWLLSAVLILALLAFISEEILVWFVVAPLFEKEEVERFSKSAQLITYNIEDWWKTKMETLRSLSSNQLVSDYLLNPSEENKEELRAFFEGASQEAGSLCNFLLSPQGEVLLSLPMRFSKSDLPSLNLLNLKEATMPYKSPTDGRELVLFLRSAESGGKELGLVGLIFDWQKEVKDLLTFPTLGTQTGECFLVELREGKILFITDLRFLSGAAFSTFLNEPEGKSTPMGKALEGKSGTEKTVDYRGVPVIASYAYIRGPGWGLVVKEDWKELTAPIRGLSWIGSGAALLLTLLLLLFSQLLFRRIVHPIKELEFQVDRIGSGLDSKIKIEKAPKEIANLTENISQMVEKIREKDQELLRYEQDWSRALTETANALIVAVDLEGRISFFNREAEKKLGYRKEDVLGKEVEMLFSSPLKEETRNFFSQLELSQIPPSLTFSLITSSKEPVLVDWAITVIREKDGSPNTIVGIGIDITEREAQLKRLDLLNKINQEIIVSDLKNLTPMVQKIREVLDAHTVLIVKTDKERKTMTPIGWNWRPGYYGIPDEVLVQKIPQTTEKGLIGYCIREGEPTISGDAERDPRAHHIEGTEYMDESVIAMPLRFQEEVLGAVFVGKKGLNQFKEEDVALLQTIAGSLAVALHNREVMESLKEEEERFRNLFTSIPDGVVIYEAQGTILEVNEALARRLGYTREELIGRNVEDLDHPESKPLSKPFLEEVKEKGTARRELLNITKTGETIPVEIFASKIQYRGKTAFIGVSRDISERKKLEQVKSDLLYAISHEMKTPIQSLMAAVDIYSVLPPARLAARSLELLEIINRNILRLKQLVDNFLESQKVEQESMNLSPLPTDIVQLIKETQGFFGPYAALKGVKFENHVPENLSWVKADQERLREVFTNIYSNALRFSPKEGKVTTIVQEREKFLEVKITDQGPGIPEVELPHLFEKFFRPQSPKLRAMAGTGLGLYITRRIVEAHGGEIGVESAEGQGTTIKFTLPKWEKHPG